MQSQSRAKHQRDIVAASADRASTPASSSKRTGGAPPVGGSGPKLHQMPWYPDKLCHYENMRLNGWKSIANHLGRDRSTVMRWAAERGMPVHRIPGGARGSVFALADELDTWLAISSVESDAETTTAAQPAVTAPTPPAQRPSPVRRWLGRHRRSHWRWGIPLLPLALFAGLGAFAWQGPPELLESPAMPQNEAAAALFLEARAEWAQRNGQSIAASIAKLQQVIAIDPSFAPAYAGLADCYVLAHEFGSMPAAEAYGRAQDAVDAALRIDPANAAAWRAKGFLDYWWRRDPQSARVSFEAAIDAAPGEAQTHFWYGNVLVDNGDFAAGIAHLDKARLLEPVSVALQTDYAYALWSSGKEADGVARLEALRARHPDLATVRDYLAVAYLAEGKIGPFVAETAALAQIRNDQPDIEEAAALGLMLPAGEQAVLALFVDQTMDDFAKGDRKTLVWPVYVASMARDRAEVMRLLTIAAQRKELWGSAGLARQIRQRWQGDREITGLLAPRRPASMVPKAS